MAKKLLRWPEWMPIPQQSGYSYQPTDRRTRTDMEVGSILRVNYDTDETQFSCTLILNSIQSAFFEQFERDILSQGTQWFEFPLKSGGNITWHTARFLEHPKATLLGVRHTTYTFTLEIEKRPVTLCPQIAEFLVCISPQDLCRAGHVLREAMREVVPGIELPDFWVPRQITQEVA